MVKGLEFGGGHGPVAPPLDPPLLSPILPKITVNQIVESEKQETINHNYINYSHHNQ